VRAAEVAAPRVAELMAPLLGWSEAEQAAQLADALEHIASFGGPAPRSELEGASAQSELRELFSALDTDADGFIGESEVASALATVRELDHRGLYFMYRYISRESCSQFDSLPLTSLTISQLDLPAAEAERSPSSQELQHAAAAAFRQMDTGVTGRVNFAEFETWFYDDARSQRSGGDDAELRSKLMLSSKKLGDGGSSGVAFG
jgi:Ca2+-binding EF-hand superfamily protein